jgi:hypothetical protein
MVPSASFARCDEQFSAECLALTAQVFIKERKGKRSLKNPENPSANAGRVQGRVAIWFLGDARLSATMNLSPRSNCD